MKISLEAVSHEINGLGRFSVLSPQAGSLLIFASPTELICSLLFVLTFFELLVLVLVAQIQAVMTFSEIYHNDTLEWLIRL